MEKNFWDRKSVKYPRASDPENLQEAREIIGKAAAMGAVFEKAGIIDIGCGAGNYALPLSGAAESVLCTDFSEGMLGVLEKEIAEAGVKNVRLLLSSFSDFPADKFLKKFDIAFASMTPAVKTAGDVLKMESLAKKTCVFVGWAGKRENETAQEVLSMHKIRHYVPKGFLEVKKILEERRVPFLSEVFERDWKWEGTVEEAVEDISARIELDKVQPDKRLIGDFFRSRFPGGKVVMRTRALKGILVWRPGSEPRL